MNEADLPSSYDALWESAWGDMQRYGPVHRHSRRELLGTVSRLCVASILDVGCGAGDNLLELSTAGAIQLTGCDVAETALALARRRIPSARFAVLDVERQTLPEKFELVMSVQVLEHVVDDVAALRNMAAMSSQYVLVSTMKGRMRPSEVAIGHVRNYGDVELRRKLDLAGLRLVRMWCWGFPFYSPIMRTATEWLPGDGPSLQRMGPISRLLASALYCVYAFNWPGRGDVLWALAEVP